MPSIPRHSTAVDDFYYPDCNRLVERNVSSPRIHPWWNEYLNRPSRRYNSIPQREPSPPVPSPPSVPVWRRLGFQSLETYHNWLFRNDPDPMEPLQYTSDALFDTVLETGGFSTAARMQRSNPSRPKSPKGLRSSYLIGGTPPKNTFASFFQKHMNTGSSLSEEPR